VSKYDGEWLTIKNSGVRRQEKVRQRRIILNSDFYILDSLFTIHFFAVEPSHLIAQEIFTFIDLCQ
jgi:hypothetical protein